MDWLNSVWEQLKGTPTADSIVKWLESGLLGLAMLVGSYFVATMFSRYVSSVVCRRVDETLGKFLGRISFYTILIVASLGILASFKVPVASAMAVLTAAGFAVGLAFQGTLSNFASGVLLLVFRPFKVGDMVTAGTVTGRINEIDLFTTTFDTPDNRRIIVPNSAIASGTIENVTFHAHRRVDVTIGVAYAAGLEQTRAALTAAAMSLSDIMIAGDKRGYQVLLGQLGPSSVDWTIRFWTATENVFAARERLTQEIKVQLMRAGIEIPFPQMQLHLSSTSREQLAPETQEASANFPMRPRMRRAGGEAA